MLQALSPLLLALVSQAPVTAPAQPAPEASSGAAPMAAEPAAGDAMVPAAADTPPPVDAPPTEMAGSMDPPGAEMMDGAASQPASAAAPPPWRVATVPVPGGGQEVRVLRPDDTAVSLGEGLADINKTDRLVERARKLEDTQTSLETIVGRAAVLAAGGVLASAGVVAAMVGAGFWLWSRTGLPDNLNAQVSAVVLQGPSILLTGLITLVIGAFVVAATGAMWAYFTLRGPPAPDAAVLQALGAQLNWDEKEAAEVVAAHNNGPAAPDAASASSQPAAEMETMPTAEEPPAEAPAPAADDAAEPMPTVPAEPAPTAPAEPAPAAAPAPNQPQP